MIRNLVFSIQPEIWLYFFMKMENWHIKNENFY